MSWGNWRQQHAFCEFTPHTPLQLSHFECEEKFQTGKKNLSDPIKPSVDEPEVFLVTAFSMSNTAVQSQSRPWRNVWRMFYCRCRVQPPQTSPWADFWWKRQHLSSLYLQSVSWHHAAVRNLASAVHHAWQGYYCSDPSKAKSFWWLMSLTNQTGPVETEESTALEKRKCAYQR